MRMVWESGTRRNTVSEPPQHQFCITSRSLSSHSLEVVEPTELLEGLSPIEWLRVYIQRAHIKKGDKFLNEAVPIVLRTIAPSPSACWLAKTFFTTDRETFTTLEDMLSFLLWYNLGSEVDKRVEINAATRARAIARFRTMS